MGSCQICTSVQNCTRGQNCTTSAQNCTKILLHEDTFARADNFTRIRFFYLFLLNFFTDFNCFFKFFFVFTVTPNPYPRSVTYKLFFYFYIFYIITVTPNPYSRRVAFFIDFFNNNFINNFYFYLFLLY